MSPLVSAPGFKVELIVIDVLHALDLGVTQEVLGSVLYEALGSFAKGRNKEQQIQALKVKLKNHDQPMKTSICVNNLSLDMVKRDGKSPKMRVKGSEARHFVPFAVEVATAMPAADDNTRTLTVPRCVSTSI